MGDVGKPRGPSASDDLLRPDAGFHDDKVGGQLKSEEAARRRAALARQAARPKHLDQAPQKVAAAGTFRRSTQEEDPVSAQAKRHQRALVAGQPAPRRDAKGRAGRGAHGGEVARVAHQVHTLFHTLVLLEQDADGAPRGADASPREAGGGQRVQAVAEREQRRREQPAAPQPEPAPLADRPGPQSVQASDDALTANATRMARAQQQARFHVQHLIAGGTGFMLDDNPAVSFAALFAKLAQWPAQVPPGRTPSSAEDFDAFFSWAFAPALPDEPLEPPG